MKPLKLIWSISIVTIIIIVSLFLTSNPVLSVSQELTNETDNTQVEEVRGYKLPWEIGKQFMVTGCCRTTANQEHNGVDRQAIDFGLYLNTPVWQCVMAGLFCPKILVALQMVMW